MCGLTIKAFSVSFSLRPKSWSIGAVEEEHFKGARNCRIYDVPPFLAGSFFLATPGKHRYMVRVYIRYLSLTSALTSACVHGNSLLAKRN